MPLKRSTSRGLCPLFCHQARPQDGLFGELKKIITENMTIGDAARYHAANWNFTVGPHIDDAPTDNQGSVSPEHDPMHVIFGVACSITPSLHHFLPYYYNGDPMTEVFVVHMEYFLADHSELQLLEALVDEKMSHKNNFVERVLKMQHEDDYLQIKRSYMQGAWQLANKPPQYEEVFALRHQYGFNDGAIFEALENRRGDISIGGEDPTVRPDFGRETEWIAPDVEAVYAAIEEPLLNMGRKIILLRQQQDPNPRESFMAWLLDTPIQAIFPSCARISASPILALR